MIGLKASKQGQVKIKQARETRGWTVRYEDTTPLKEASKVLIEQHRMGNNWNPNDSRWLRDWEKLFRVEQNRDINAIKLKVLQSQQGSILERIENLIDAGEILAKDISYGTWSRFACLTTRHAIKARSFKAYCQILELDWQEIVEQTNLSPTPLLQGEGLSLHPPRLAGEGGRGGEVDSHQDWASSHPPRLAGEGGRGGEVPHQDWADAPDVPTFFGRDAELVTLKQWILEDRCRLVAILGIRGIGKTAVSVKLGKGGIGKTDLSLKLARSLQDEFEYVIWRSLLNAPPVTEIIADLIQFLSQQLSTDLPDRIDKQISLLLQYLKHHRCLLILDNVETILEAGNSAGKCKPGYEDYGQLLEKIGEVPHQSCLILTIREKIDKIERLEGKHKPVRFLQLKGLEASEGRHIFNEIGDFSGSDDEWKQLIEFYNGNPLALEFAAHHIRDEFAGDISEFLRQGKPIFAHLRELLDWHFARLSDCEKEILYWLAIHREPISVANLKDDIVSSIAKERVAESLRSLHNKLPLEKSENRFTLQPVLIEYITEKLIEKVCQ
ncbi:NB-ARC domain-containing protein [Microseira sp. BLCC-F43]|jgi:hypothetical protein|uniref:NB-ARC domain-containing protein n=1 Tax=Microseira sp. BLCC-F43 TaxID=3153602 RepID=UPI0035B9EF93